MFNPCPGCDFAGFARTHFQRLSGEGGRGLRVLGEATASPGAAAMRDRIMKRFPACHWHTYEPVGRWNEYAGTALASGRPLRPHLALDRADLIVSLDDDLLQDHPAVFIYGIGWPLADGYPHEMRAADYDDWVTETVSSSGKPMHGLNGDILVWNPVTKRRHELTSMGVRVNKETLVKQLEMSGQQDFLELPYHQAILNDEIPLSIGGGIGQARTYMQLLRKAHLGEVSVTVWPQILKDMCRERNIHVLE